MECMPILAVAFLRIHTHHHFKFQLRRGIDHENKITLAASPTTLIYTRICLDSNLGLQIFDQEITALCDILHRAVIVAIKVLHSIFILHTSALHTTAGILYAQYIMKQQLLTRTSVCWLVVQILIQATQMHAISYQRTGITLTAQQQRHPFLLNGSWNIPRGGAATSVTKSSANIRKQVKSNKESATKVIKKSDKNTEDPRIIWLIRLLFLTYYGSLGSLLPYLPVYYHSLGHGGQIIGLLGAVKPFTTFLVGPLWTFAADQSPNPFFILQLSFFVSLLGQLSIAFNSDALYLSVMVFLTAFFNAPVKSLIDSMVMSHLHNPSASYGRLRLWGQMGFGLGSSIVGMLLHGSRVIPWPSDHSFSPAVEAKLQLFPDFVRATLVLLDKFWTSLTGYKLLFLTHAALSIPTWLCIQAFRKLDADKTKLAEKKNGKSVSKKSSTRMSEGLVLLLQNTDALLFFFLVFVAGVSSGVIENFAYVRMREVGGTGREMGFSRLVSSLAGAPMFWFSGTLTQALGADRVIVLSLMSYVLRFLIYALMRNPYHGLPAEALRGVTFAAFWSSGTVYAHEISPPGLHATMLMFFNAMYGGLGQSVGAIIGGKLQHRVGTVQTFVYSAAFDFCFVCAVVLYLSLRKSSNFRDPTPIDTKKTPTTKRKSSKG